MASGQLPKKRSHEESSMQDDGIVEVSVQDLSHTPRRFLIHKHLLCSQSSRFDQLLQDQAENAVIVLSGVGADEFETFSQWLYQKRLVVAELEEESAALDELILARKTRRIEQSKKDTKRRGNRPGAKQDANEITLSHENEVRDLTSNAGCGSEGEDKPWYITIDRKERIFARLLDLYIFADKFTLVSFKQSIMLDFQRLTVSTRTLPTPTFVKHAVENLDMQSSLCKYLVLGYAHDDIFDVMRKFPFSTLPSIFLAALVLFFYQRVDDERHFEDFWHEDCCEYHEHKSCRNYDGCSFSGKTMTTWNKD